MRVLSGSGHTFNVAGNGKTTVARHSVASKNSSMGTRNPNLAGKMSEAIRMTVPGTIASFVSNSASLEFVLWLCNVTQAHYDFSCCIKSAVGKTSGFIVSVGAYFCLNTCRKSGY